LEGRPPDAHFSGERRSPLRMSLNDEVEAQSRSERKRWTFYGSHQIEFWISFGRFSSQKSSSKIWIGKTAIPHMGWFYSSGAIFSADRRPAKAKKYISLCIVATITCLLRGCVYFDTKNMKQLSTWEKSSSRPAFSGKFFPEFWLGWMNRHTLAGREFGGKARTPGRMN